MNKVTIPSGILSKIDALSSISPTTKTRYKSMLKLWYQCFDNPSNVVADKQNMITFTKWLLSHNYHVTTAGNTAFSLISLSRRLGNKIPSDIDAVQRALMVNYAKNMSSDDIRGASVLTQEMFNELLEVINNKWNTRELIKERFKLFCLLAYNSCARIAEILNLERNHIIIRRNQIYVHLPGTKTPKSDRKIYIDKTENIELYKTLIRWIRKFKLQNEDHIIPTISYQGRSKTKYTVNAKTGVSQMLINRHFNDVYAILFKQNPNVWKNINLSSHSLRKTQATNIFKTEESMQKLLDKGGWSDKSESVTKYINIPLVEDKKDVDESTVEKIYSMNDVLYYSDQRTLDYLKDSGVVIDVKGGVLRIRGTK